MNQNELVGSLTPEQTIAFSAVLIFQRDQLSAMYVATEAGLVATHTVALRILTAEVTQLKADLAVSQANETNVNTRMARLLIELPFNPRLISTPAFLARIADLMFPLAKYASSDTVAAGFLVSLFEKDASKESIKLDSPKLAGALGYLIAKEWLESERADAITRDCTRDEAYSPE